MAIRAGGWIVTERGWRIDASPPKPAPPAVRPSPPPGPRRMAGWLLEPQPEPEPEPPTVTVSVTQWPRHSGGGWYELSDGSRVRGTGEAHAAQQSLDEGTDSSEEL